MGLGCVNMQLSRSFGTIHAGHLSEDFLTVEEYYYFLRDEFLPGSKWIHAGAFALEEGDKAGRVHIQFYMEHERKRPRTLAKMFQVTTEYLFRTVINAPSAWDYCTGQGRHEGKQAFDRLQFGEPLLTESGNKADLKLLVGLIVTGTHPTEILKEHPYAYTVHRRRIWDLYLDIKGIDRLERSQEEWRGR